MQRDIKTVLLISFLVIALWALSGWILYRLPDRGTFGDMFGAINALFSGLAFVGVIYAILLQKTQLNDTKAEFYRNAEAQERAAKLSALTVIFTEYKFILEQKEEEFERAIKSIVPAIPGGFGGSDYLKAVQASKDKALDKKLKVLKLLEEMAGLNEKI